MRFFTSLLTISLFLLLLIGCKKTEIDPNVTPGSTGTSTSRPPCETQGYGWIDATNSSNNPYDLWINGVYVTQLKANALTKNIQISKGPSKIYVKQVSGYLFYATEKSWSPTIESCKSIYISFP